eukprot:11791-Rhodomonas_salina.1
MLRIQDLVVRTMLTVEGKINQNMQMYVQDRQNTLPPHGHAHTHTKKIIESTATKLNDLFSPLFSVQMHVPYKQNCYELFGFDVMLDAALKPWLIE